MDVGHDLVDGFVRELRVGAGVTLGQRVERGLALMPGGPAAIAKLVSRRSMLASAMAPVGSSTTVGTNSIVAVRNH